MILVTGANGLAGSFICRKLLDENKPFKALVRENSDLSWLDDVKDKIEWAIGDIMDVISLESHLEEVETVIHCAAIVSFVPSMKKKLMHVNVEGTANVVNASLKKGVSRLVHLSSVAALGKPKGVKVIDESAEWVKTNIKSAYAESKHLAELEVWRGYSEGLETVIVNPSVILGPCDWNKSSGMLFKYVYQENLFYTPGVINYVDVRDLAEICFQLMNSDINGERFVLSSGNAGYKELFSLIAKYLDKKPPRIKVNTTMIYVAMILEKFKSWVTGSSPIITRETIEFGKMEVVYDHSKITNTLNFTFRNLEDSIRWTCSELLKSRS